MNSFLRLLFGIIQFISFFSTNKLYVKINQISNVSRRFINFSFTIIFLKVLYKFLATTYIKMGDKQPACVSTISIEINELKGK